MAATFKHNSHNYVNGDVMLRDKVRTMRNLIDFVTDKISRLNSKVCENGGFLFDTPQFLELTRKLVQQL